MPRCTIHQLMREDEQRIDSAGGDKQQASEICGNPRKLVKTELDAAVSENVFCNCFSPQDTQSIVAGIHALKNYSKIACQFISHQEASLKTLKPSILMLLPQLRQRVSDCVLRARANSIVLETIAASYSKLDLMAFHSKDALQKAIEKANISSSSLLSLLEQICEDWADLGAQSRQPLLILISLLQKYCNNDRQSIGRLMLQGSGIARVVYEMKASLRIEHLESYEERVLHYLCGEYFLYHCNKTHQIYPFIHSFSNSLQERTPFQSLTVPNICCNFSESGQIYTNFGSFQQKCRSPTYNSQWDCFVSYFCTARVSNVLEWLQIIYKGLKEHGLWINICCSNFESNVMEMTYKEFRYIIDKSQFKVQEEFERRIAISLHREHNMIKEFVQAHFLVLTK